MLFHSAQGAGGFSVGGEGGPISLGEFAYLTNQTSDASRTLTLSGITVGSLIIVMIANRSALGTPPDLTSGTGYTSELAFGSSGADRGIRVLSKIATSTSDSVSWIGSYGFIVEIKNATAVSAKVPQSSSTIVGGQYTPAITPNYSDGTSFILGSNYTSSGGTGVTSPYGGYTTSFVYLEGNTNSSIPATIHSAPSAYATCFAIELI